MVKLVESKLQKALLLIGGVSILLRLSNVNYYQTYTAVLQALGIGIFTFILLVLTKDYKPQIHHKIWRGIKRYWIILAILILALFAWFANNAYSKYLAVQKFHASEMAYQNCLDKVAAQDKQIKSEEDAFRAAHPYKGYPVVSNDPFGGIFGESQVFYDGYSQIQNQSYFYQWGQANRPGYNDAIGFWEVYFMNWMMQNHPDYCAEFNPDVIKTFVAEKLVMLTKQ